ncbi:hypothetical protein ACWIGY_29225 [Streptomyces anulatus]
MLDHPSLLAIEDGTLVLDHPSLLAIEDGILVLDHPSPSGD